MRSYILRRILLLIPTLLFVTMLVFFLASAVPGDVIDAMMAQPGAEDANYDREQLEKLFGLDVPKIVQYGRWMGILPRHAGSFSGLFQGDFGRSFWLRKSVIGEVVRALPVTIQLGLMSIVLSQLISLPIGIYSAVRQNTIGDHVGRSIAILFLSIPLFWLGTIVIVYPAVWWGAIPSIRMIPFAVDPIRNLRMMILPSVVLSMSMAGTTMRMTRTMMLEVQRQDYIRSAWAKGLKEHVIIVRHALKNALIPVVTIVGLQLPMLIGGTVIVEDIFNLPGMGRLLVAGIRNRDEPVIAGVVVLYAIGVMVINLAVDMIYAFLDPRIRYK